MNTNKVHCKYFSIRFLWLAALLITLHIPGVVLGETNASPAKSEDMVNILHPEHIKILEENVNTLQDVAVQLKGIRQTMDGKLSDIGRNTNVSSDISKLNQSLAKLPDAIEGASPGFLSSLFGWIFQVIAIVVGAGVAIFVMNKQVEASQRQFLVN